MKKYIYTLLVLFVVPFLGTAQDSDEVQQDTIVKTKEKLERSAFESSYIIDNQTNVVLSKNALEIMLQHRFATVQNGWDDYHSQRRIFERHGLRACRNPRAASQDVR